MNHCGGYADANIHSSAREATKDKGKWLDLFNTNYRDYYKESDNNKISTAAHIVDHIDSIMEISNKQQPAWLRGANKQKKTTTLTDTHTHIHL